MLKNAKFKPRIGWLDSRRWGIFLVFTYILLAALPIIIALIERPATGEPVLVQIALAAALFVFSLICLQVMLAERLKTICRPFGYDVLINFHKGIGMLAMILIISHPILLAFSYSNWNMLTLETSWQVNLGQAALLFLILGVLFSLLFKKFGIDYNIWRFGHKGMFIVIILAFIHSFLIGPDIQSGFLRIYWVIMFCLVTLVFLYRNIAVPLWIRYKCEVSDITQETHDTYTLTFKPENSKEVIRNPGQFMFLKLIRPGRKSELHPFTISASPLRTDIFQATIKKSGNFTDTIDQTKPGDTGKIEAPYGRFSYIYHDPEQILFIAGGVGITPIMSMMRCLRETGDTRPVTLLYANKTEKDIIFRKEIEELPKNFETIYVLSKADESWQGERGHITTEIIKKYSENILKNAHVFLCGPPVMMDKVIDSLRELKVDDKRIHYERFTI